MSMMELRGSLKDCDFDEIDYERYADSKKLQLQMYEAVDKADYDLCRDTVKKMNRMFDEDGNGIVDRCEQAKHCVVLMDASNPEMCIWNNMDQSDHLTLDEALEFCEKFGQKQ